MNRSTSRTLKHNADGFTIVELMIALSILSVILVTATLVLISVGRLYSKGVNSANIQNTSRNVTSDLSSALQFGGEAPVPCTLSADTRTCYASSHVYAGMASPVYSFCIGTARYNYVLDQELGVSTAHILWRDTLPSTSAPCVTLDLSQSTPTGSSSDGYELAGNKMRITRLKVLQTSPGSDLYDVDVWMAYGDDDLVNTAGVGSPSPGHSTCNGGRGTEYCAVSEVSTTVSGRVY
jgi:prepilin-type N-terminal cleavage/methylation domain-containing protein